MARGPDYANHLTDAEQRTLDALVGEVTKRGAAGGKAGRGSWRAPVAAGLAALVILSAATVVSQLDVTGGSPAPPASTGPGQVTMAPDETLAELAAAAAATVPDPQVPDDYWVLHQLHVIINGDAEPCQVTATDLTVREPVSQPDRPYIWLTAEQADPGGPAATRAYRPDPATGWPGCAETADTVRPTPRFEHDGEPGEVWQELTEWLKSRFPGFVYLAGSGDFLLTGGDDSPVQSAMAIGWWAELVANLTGSPQLEATARAELLREAASRDDVVAVPEVTVDQIGRPGTTVRVPYGDRTDAELTFDRDTGALLQRVVFADSGVQITAYLNDRGS